MPQAGRLHPTQQQAIANGGPITNGRVQQAPGMPNGLPQGARPSPNMQHAMPNGTVPVGMNGIPVNLQRHPQAQIQGRPMSAEQIQQLRMLQQAKTAQMQGQQGYPQCQPGAVAQMQSGFPVPQTANQQAAVKAMMLQQAQHAALGGQKNPNVPNGQAGSPRMQQQPLNPQQQQQQQQQQGGPGELNPHTSPLVPMQLTAVEMLGRGQGLQLTAAEMTALVQHQNPHLAQDQVAKATAQHLASYHQQLSQNMAQQRNPNSNGQPTASSPVMQTPTSQQLLQRVQQQQAQQAQARAAAANTGPMIGANGPVGPGANGSRSATPQQQRSGSAQSPRSVQQSPSLGQAVLVGGQQQQQQQQQQGQGQGQGQG